jgi:hypothetical protein
MHFILDNLWCFKIRVQIFICAFDINFRTRRARVAIVVDRSHITLDASGTSRCSVLAGLAPLACRRCILIVIDLTSQARLATRRA